jgi:hypothetical protein
MLKMVDLSMQKNLAALNSGWLCRIGSSKIEVVAFIQDEIRQRGFKLLR